MVSPSRQPPPERRLQGRVPFVRRCTLAFADGRAGQALIVNINTVGAYVAHDDLAGTGAAVEPRRPQLPLGVAADRLGVKRVLIAGERAYDLAVRLQVNGVPFEYVGTFAKAVDAVPPGKLEVIANYSAFQDIRAELDRVL